MGSGHGHGHGILVSTLWTQGPSTFVSRAKKFRERAHFSGSSPSSVTRS
jgi:hypothetical protein